ncbi:MAG: cation diffusion facilitator family transporter, partial [Candidatus Dormibacterales bacterium]
MARDRGPGRAGPRRGLAVGVGLTLAILCLELGAGAWSHSLALLSDAGHELADAVSLGLALFALSLAERPADDRRTYGYNRAGILAALANAAILAVVVAAILAEAARRLAHPQPVHGEVVLVAGALAVAANAYLAVRLRASASDLNVRAVLAHVAGDLLGAAGA